MPMTAGFPLRIAILAVLTVFGSLIVPSGARAQQCGATTTITSPISFTGVDLLGGGAVDTTATLTVRCTGLVGLVQVCVSIEAGTGGANGQAARYMRRVGGTESLRYQLYQDSARTIPWGSQNDPSLGTVPAIGVTLVLGIGGTATRTIYARVLPNQGTLPPGQYVSTVPTNLRFGPVSTLTDCNGLLTYSEPGPSFGVEANLVKNCLLAIPQNVNFGSVSLLNQTIDAVGSLSIRCTNGTPYTVSLGPGTAPGATVTTRRMRGPGGASIAYDLFRDAGRSEFWGQTIGADTLGGLGIGIDISTPIYGRVRPQATPSAGVYSDTVVVTVTY